MIKGQDSPEATHEAARRLLERRPDIAGVYNVAGGNRDLVQALTEGQLARRPLYIGHEVNEVTEPLLRAGVIDFLITQNVELLVHTTRQLLIDLKLAKKPVRELHLVPVQIVSEFTLFPGRN